MLFYVFRSHMIALCGEQTIIKSLFTENLPLCRVAHFMIGYDMQEPMLLSIIYTTPCAMHLKFLHFFFHILGASPYRDCSIGHSSDLLLHQSLCWDASQGRGSSGFFCLQDVWLHSLSGAVFLMKYKYFIRKCYFTFLFHSNLLCW